MKSQLSIDLPSVDVFQIGAREHYMVPEMLRGLGLLRYLHTDLYVGKGSPIGFISRLAQFLPSNKRFRKLLDRTSSLPSENVKTYILEGVLGQISLAKSNSVRAETEANHNFQNALSKSIVNNTDPPPDVIVGFRGSDELFKAWHGQAACVLDQIDGALHEVEIIRAEQSKYADWLPEGASGQSQEFESNGSWLDIEAPRLAREWRLADLIVCNSKWTVSCLGAAGVDTSKCIIVPLAYEHNGAQPKQRMLGRRGGLRVGFLGTLTLRKGIHILLEACRDMPPGVEISVEAAGVLDVNSEVISRYGSILNWRGVLPRSRLDEFFQSIDVLALPSISEGFGLVQLEAMSRGIPVIVSDRAGDVVRDGVDGRIVPAGDPDPLRAVLIDLSNHPETVYSMGEAAIERSKDFSPEKVSAMWRSAIAQAVDIFRSRRG